MCTDVQQKSTSAQRIGELWLGLIVGNIVCDLCFTYTVDVIVAILAENCNTDLDSHQNVIHSPSGAG